MALPTFFTKVFETYNNTPVVKTAKAILSNTTDVLTKTNTSSYAMLTGGTNSGSGARLFLCGKDKATNAGEFWLGATDGTNTAELKGTPSGSLTWNGSEAKVQSDVLTLEEILASSSLNGKIPNAESVKILGTVTTIEKENFISLESNLCTFGPYSYVEKYGNFIHATVGIVALARIDTWTAFATIKEPYRPKGSLIQMFKDGHIFYLSTAGSVQHNYPSLESGTLFFLNALYHV